MRWDTYKRVIRLRVKEVAALKGLSQAQLSRRSDVDITTVRKIYRHPTEANITLLTLNRLAQALGVDPRELIEVLPDKVPPQAGSSS